MAFLGAKIIRIIPDQQGRGGSKTSLSTHSINLDIRLASNVFVNYGRWRQATQAIAADGFDPYPNVFHSYSLHNFARFDTNNANLPPIDTLLSHNQLINADQQIAQHNPVFTVKVYTPPPGVVDTVAATFLNVKNRCFICWAATNNFIYTGHVTYDVGIDAPATPPTYTLGDTGADFVFVTAGGLRVTFIAGPVPFSSDIRFVTIGGKTFATQQPDPLFSGPYAAPGTVTGTAGSAIITISGTWPTRDYAGLAIHITGQPESPDATRFVMGYTFPSAGVTQVTLSLPLTTSPAGAAYTLDGTQLILADPYNATADTATITYFGFPGVFTSNTVATLFFGPLSWDESPPQYAYAYYDYPGLIEPGLASGTIGTNTITITGASWGLLRYRGVTIRIGSDTYTVQDYTVLAGTTTVTTVEALTATYPVLPPGTATNYTLSSTLSEYGTGHVSECSDILSVTEQTVSGVSVVLSNIIPSGAADQPRFNKILIFRSLLSGGGGQLIPFQFDVGMIDNLGTAPLSFTDSFDDGYLLRSPGFIAPTQGFNRKPPPFAHQAQWDTRIFGNPVNDPSAIVYSGDIVQILFGVAEECYPSANILRIPSDDGRVTGMALMGPLLVITTERYAYYVTGSGDGNNPYRLLRFSTMMYGVGDKQMVEFAGATVDDSDLLIYVGKDKKFYITAPALGNITVSDPVQDMFTNGIGELYDRVRVANIAVNGNHYLVVALGASFNAHLYDWDRKVWLSHNAQTPDHGSQTPQAFCTVFGSTVPVRFLYIINGEVFEWLGESNTLGVVPPAAPFVETMPLSGDRKSKHRLQFVRAYVSDASEPWQVLITIDEKGPGTLATMIEQPDPILSLQPPGSSPIDNPNAKELVYFPASDSTAQLDGYRFQVRLVYPNSTTVRDAYVLELCLVDLEPMDQVSQ